MEGQNLKYTDLGWIEGTSVLPGIRKDVYAIAKRDIVTWPTLPSTVTTKMGELSTYTGNFVLAANKKWQKVGVTIEESSVDSKPQGTKPSRTFLNTGVLQHSGTGEEATGFARQANNDDMVFLFRESGGKFRVIGNEMFPTEVDVEQSIGAGVTGKSGSKITTKATDVCPPPFYTGEIITEDGTINDATP